MAGTAGGIVLGFFLKTAEWLTGKKVYTLLLNVDFIPLLNRIAWPEWMEFFFHLLLSFSITAVFLGLLFKTKRPFTTAFVLMLPTVFLYYPLSILSHKPVAAPYDGQAFGWWAAGHALYALVLGLYGQQKIKREA
ncbi:hypothetical protein L2D08_02530 [Domibacillus sp. PGB-M46]|uniref:hypothetical protein n=1 Tax=Domibacillus sp. PGB-M46 TaxID=2910255 RepID=UPI001F5702D7|nr:hypothetical protein [Domibacillus sp. PGB-M46]MCI2253238.1 hypothetical protein [Domibacillus sp. PGB-M46]